MDEKWLDVVECEDSYEVSDIGNFRSKDRTTPHGRRRKSQPIALAQGRGGYLFATLWKDGKSRSVYAHVAVLEAFVGPRPEGMLALHRDDDRTNNSVGNLYWGTPSENSCDAVRNGKNWNALKTRCGRGHLLTGANLRERKDRKGRRCVSCDRAAGRVRRGDERSIDSIAAEIYEGLGVEVSWGYGAPQPKQDSTLASEERAAAQAHA